MPAAFACSVTSVEAIDRPGRKISFSHVTALSSSGAMTVVVPCSASLTQVPQLGDRGKFFSLFLIGESCFLGQINGSPAGS